MLLAALGCVLFFGFVSGNLEIVHLLWAVAGIATCLGITSGVMRTLFPHMEETKRWQRFIETARGLQLHARGGIARPSITGKIDDCDVRISPVNRDHIIVISAPSHGAHFDISLSPKTDDDERERSIRLGDDEFDHRVVVQGNVPEVVALLDVKTRRMVVELMDELSVEVRRRQVLKYGRHLELDPGGTLLCLRRMAELSERLFRVSAREIQDRLANNARCDPNPKVRALNLRLLCEYYPPDQRMRSLGRTALSSDHLECVLEGAIGLAEAGDGLDRLRAFRHLADIAAADTFADELRSPALDALALHFPDQARELVEGVAQEMGPLPSALPSAMLQLGIEPDLDRLTDRAASTRPESQIEVVRRLAEHGLRFEKVLLALLDSPSERVQLEVVEALSSVGSVEAVESILPLTRGFLRSKKLRARAQVAIRTIQDRLEHPGDGGELSLSDPLRGELSVRGQRGDLSGLPSAGGSAPGEADYDLSAPGRA